MPRSSPRCVGMKGVTVYEASAVLKQSFCVALCGITLDGAHVIPVVFNCIHLSNVSFPFHSCV